MKPLWKRIWSLSVASKIRNFLWRACKDAIPTLKNLKRRCVVEDSSCSLCAQHYEDALHALWSCPALAQVWNEDPQWNFRDQKAFQDFPHLLLHVFESGCSAEMFALQTWTIWYRRNNVRIAPPGFPPNLFVQRAIEALMEYRSAQPKKTVATPTVRPRARWSPPPVGWFKANFDATISQDVGRAGLGVILSDSQGLAMVSLAQNIQLASSVAEMEALAATRALELAAELGFDRVIFEGDSTSVITSLTDQVSNLALFGLLIKEAQDLALRLNHVKFQHVGRDGNSVAHNLTRYARHVMGFSL